MQSFHAETMSELQEQVERELRSREYPGPVSSHEWQVFFAIVKYLSGDVAYREHSEQGAGEGRKDDFGIFIPNTRYHLNTKLTTLAAAAMILDAFVTAGIVSGVLALTGQLKQSLTALQVEKGELCVAMEVMSLSEGAASLSQKTWSGRCAGRGLNCKWRTGDQCAISTDAICSILDELRVKGVVEKSDGGLKLAI